MVAAIGPPEHKAGEHLQLPWSVASGLSMPRMPTAVTNRRLLLMRFLLLGVRHSCQH